MEIRADYPRADFLIHLARAGHLMLSTDADTRITALDDDEPVGFLVARGGLVRLLFVLPQHRRKRVGGHLLNALRKQSSGPLVTVPVGWELAEFFLTCGWTPDEPEEILFRRDLRHLPRLLPIQGYQIRSYAPEDEPEWHRFTRTILPNGVPPPDPEHHLAFLALEGSTAVGTVVTDPHKGMLLWLAVHPQHRRKGVAEALTLLALYGLQAHDHPLALASIRPAFEPALELLRKLGFELHEPRVIFRSEGG